MEENKRKKDEKKPLNATNNADMVTTLDGRVVNKKDIKEGEIYINAEGKKVRKVVRKIVKDDTGSNVVNSGANSFASNSVVSEKKNDQKGDVALNREEFLERVNSRHSFLERIKNNEKVSGQRPVVAQTPTQAMPQEDAIEDVESVTPDRSVSELESAVVDENLANSLGKGTSYASASIGGESKVSGLATNPNAKATDILSQANNPISRSLTGNQVAAIPMPTNALPKKKEKKKRKPIKLWIPMVAIASVYVIVCLVYFFTTYNFADKSVNLGMYYIDVGADSKKEYYDGQKFNFYELIMTYYWSEEDIEKYDLTKLNMVEPTNSMGYTLNNGYINAIWDGEYASESVEYRDVDVKFLYNEEVCYVPVRIYKNILTSLNCYSSVQDMEESKAGDSISVTVFGVYTNKVMVDEGINSIERKMESGEYDLWIHLYRGTSIIDARQKLVFDENTKTYTLPEMVAGFSVRYAPGKYASGNAYSADDIKITANAVDDYDINCYTYDKYSVATYDEEQNANLRDEDKPFTIRTINSQLSATTTELTSARFNQPFVFSILPNAEKGYTLREGHSVSYNIKDSDGNYKYTEFKTLTADNMNNYRIEREEVRGDVVVKVDKCLNTYKAVFYTKLSGDADYIVKTTLELTKGNEIYWQSGNTGVDYFTFVGWQELKGDGELGPVIQQSEWRVDNNHIMGTNDRIFYAQYDYSENAVEYAGEGFEIVDTEGHILSASAITTFTYNKPLEFRLRIKDGYSFGDELVRLMYKVADGSYTTLIPMNCSSYQQYNESHVYRIDGTVLTGILTFDLNMQYDVKTTSEMYTVNVDSLRRASAGASDTTHITITLNPGHTAVGTLELKYNGITADNCSTSHTSGNTYCFVIKRSKITDDVNIEVLNIGVEHNVFTTAGDGETKRFKVVTPGTTTEINKVVVAGNDFTFALDIESGFKLDESAGAVSATVNGSVVTVSKDGDNYTINANSITGDITIIVTGIVEDIPEEEGGEPSEE